jgi:hypothetical protein
VLSGAFQWHGPPTGLGLGSSKLHGPWATVGPCERCGEQFIQIVFYKFQFKFELGLNSKKIRLELVQARVGMNFESNF